MHAGARAHIEGRHMCACFSEERSREFPRGCYPLCSSTHYPLSAINNDSPAPARTCSSVSILGPSTMSIISSTDGRAGNRGRGVMLRGRGLMLD
jgi:hypothetical protein